MWSYSMGWGGWLMMSTAMVAFWAIVVFGIVALFRSVSGTPESRKSDQRWDAIVRRVLDDRFARGEIDEQEYLARSDVLRSTAAKH